MKEHMKKYWHIYLSIILFIIGSFHLSKSFADECISPCEYYSHPLAIRHMEEFLCKSPEYEQCKTIQQKFQFHKENAERCYNDAKDKCWWLPDISRRKKAQYCFSNIAALMVSGDAKSKLIVVLVNTLVQYSIDCCDEWNYINEKLHWSQYHYEMMEFYEDLIKKGYS
jgi:hypothetical protein